MSIVVRAVDYHVTEVRTRMPFRYGIAELRACPHLFVSVEAEVDGRRERGVAADHLPPKWFTKDPQSAYADDLRDMIGVIRAAGEQAVSGISEVTVYGWWERLYAAQKAWAEGKAYPPLLWNFGVSLIERAVIDAACRAWGVPFHRALSSGRLGVPGEITALLPRAPRASVQLRHTVGLSDPLTDAEIADGDRVDDGLPQSLEASIAAYGLTRFKIKLSGDPRRDADRLERIATTLDRSGGDYAFTLDGNENFRDLGPFRELWSALSADGRLKAFLGRCLFVEQPFHRDVALTDALAAGLRRWGDRPPIIIDESDGELGSAVRALECGYIGTSHKNCKGVFKGIRNAGLIARKRVEDPAGRYVISGEDLTNIGPVALPQDLAVVAALGIEHVERNGQHYFMGLSMFPDNVSDAVLRGHGDLYYRHARGYITLGVHRGELAMGTINEAPFGVAADVDVAQFESLGAWEKRVLAPGGRGI